MARGKDGETTKAKVERGGVADEAKAKAIELAVSSIEKQFGKGAITRMTDDAANHEIACFSTGVGINLSDIVQRIRHIFRAFVSS